MNKYNNRSGSDSQPKTCRVYLSDPITSASTLLLDSNHSNKQNKNGNHLTLIVQAKKYIKR